MALPNGNMLQQASHIWKMLDELADSDPEAYKNFISKNLSEAKRVFEVPTASMSIKTKLKGHEDKYIFVNICTWNRVPKPESDTDPVSITAGPLEKQRVNGDFCYVTRVAVNPYVVEECSKNKSNLHLLLNLVLDYLEGEHKLELNKNFTFCDKQKYYGDPTELKNFFGKKSSSPEEILKENISNLSPTNVLSQLGKISTEETIKGDEETRDKIRFSLGDDKRNSKKLIEEISSDNIKLPEPSYDVKLKEADGRKGRRLVVRIHLPGVASVQECELDVTQLTIHLLVKEKFELDLPLPEKVLDVEASAKFINKNSSLTICLPLPPNS